MYKFTNQANMFNSVVTARLKLNLIQYKYKIISNLVRFKSMKNRYTYIHLMFYYISL
jgi:hypothetical protein